ncbi:MAG: multifunctional CCA addition/repair protein [Porticoccaceae bacterium]
MNTYLVGGAIRDRLLGLPVRERDWVVVGATPEAMRARGFRPVGRDFPVFLHPDTGEEYALARTERKTAPGHTGFMFHAEPGVTLEQDLQRRDLTINAIAESTEGLLIDPCGGLRDLENRVLRHVSDAFVEDPLRVLRVARFAASLHPLGFRVAPETLTLMTTIAASGELEHLSAERIWRETERALGSPSPRTYIEVLRACGALRVLLPEVDALFGVPQRADYHPEIDTGLHVLMALDRAAEMQADSTVSFAVLMHDLGKAATPADVLPRHIGHEASGVPLVNEVCDRLRAPNPYRRLAVAVTRYHLQCHRIRELRPITVLKILQALDIYRRFETLEPFLMACEADARGRGGGLEMQPYESAAWLRGLVPRVLAVRAAPHVAAGLAGAALADAINRDREAVIAAYRWETAHAG